MKSALSFGVWIWEKARWKVACSCGVWKSKRRMGRAVSQWRRVLGSQEMLPGARGPVIEDVGTGG
jgi:hypothetical protein